VRDCGLSVAERFIDQPVEFSPAVIELVERAAAAQGFSTLRMPSGAFHDAQFIVPLCPTGMIFVPSRKGISHNPAKCSEPVQLAKGTRLLAQVLAELAAS
jgi:beta-ureidopropionase / N-carbamoyl-L-amino-acid hydrolase